MQQFEKLKELKIIPDELDLCIRMVHFKKYVLDDVALIEKHIDETKKKIPKRINIKLEIISSHIPVMATLLAFSVFPAPRYREVNELIPIAVPEQTAIIPICKGNTIERDAKYFAL